MSHIQPTFEVETEKHTKIKILAAAEGIKIHEWYRKAVDEKLAREKDKLEKILNGE